jgi:hypothetical protein
MVDLEADFLAVRTIDYDIPLSWWQTMSSALLTAVIGGGFDLIANLFPVVRVARICFHKTLIV